MRRIGSFVAGALVCAAVFAAGSVVAQEGGADGQDTGEVALEGGGGEFELPDWTEKHAQHEGFAKFEGRWKVAQKMWMAPGAPPTEGTARASMRLVWDGRFVEQTFLGEFQGSLFEGHHTLAFDNVDQEYVSIWRDSSSTYLSISRGKEKDGVIDFVTHDPDWITGQKKTGHVLLKWVSDDEYTLEFVVDGPDGKPFTMMLMTYTRG